MSIRVMQWVWENSPAKDAARVVLLAIADCASDDGGNAWPSVPTLAQKANVSVRTVQYAIKRLVADGLIEVGAQAGPNGVNRYRVIMQTGASSAPQPGAIPAPRKACTGADSDVAPVQPATAGVQSTTKPVQQIAPVTVLEPSIEPSIEPSNARGFNQRVANLASRWCSMQPVSNLNKVKSVIAKALGAGWTDTEMRAAMDRLIEDRYGMTEDSLRIALQSARAPTSTTNTKVAQALNLAARLRENEQKAIER